MSKVKGGMSLATLSAGLATGLSIEVKKSRLGAVMLLSGVMSVEALSDTAVTALSHSGRVFIFGERLIERILNAGASGIESTAGLPAFFRRDTAHLFG